MHLYAEPMPVWGYLQSHLELPMSPDDYLLVEIPFPVPLQLLLLCILSSLAVWAEMGENVSSI